MEQNREPQNRPTQIQLTNLCQRTKAINEERIIFSIKDARTTGSQWATKINVDADHIPFIKINSKWIIDIKVTCKATTLLEIT